MCTTCSLCEHKTLYVLGSQQVDLSIAERKIVFKRTHSNGGNMVPRALRGRRLRNMRKEVETSERCGSWRAILLLFVSMSDENNRASFHPQTPWATNLTGRSGFIDSKLGKTMLKYHKGPIKNIRTKTPDGFRLCTTVQGSLHRTSRHDTRSLRLNEL